MIVHTSQQFCLFLSLGRQKAVESTRPIAVYTRNSLEKFYWKLPREAYLVVLSWYLVEFCKRLIENENTCVAKISC